METSENRELNGPEFVKLKSVVVTDGVDANEASCIAQCYFLREISGCGGCSVISEAGDNWQCATSVGYAAHTGPVIFIDKRTGRIKCNGYPSIEDPLSLGRVLKKVN